jgi:hypothetical protein
MQYGTRRGTELVIARNLGSSDVSVGPIAWSGLVSRSHPMGTMKTGVRVSPVTDPDPGKFSSGWLLRSSAA